MTAFRRLALSTGTALLAGLCLSVTSAGASPVAKHTLGAAPSAVVQMHDDYWDGRYYRRYHRHRYYGDRYYGDGYYGRRVVRAPFTRVETGRRVVVDAPFAHVYAGPRGRHIVAPFVDLWVPY